MQKKIETALISVYDKTGLDDLLKELSRLNIKIISTGGTKSYIENQGYECVSVESITDYPSILGGRVKTLHPKIFGGILGRRSHETDVQEIEKYGIPYLDLVIVDLYPFSETVKSGAEESDIIEKIDIGGISLIRAAAKNYKDTLIVPDKKSYSKLLTLLREKNGVSELEDRREFAKLAFGVSSEYDSDIFNYFDGESFSGLRIAEDQKSPLRYGENPHQKAAYFGHLEECFEQLWGKEISYNNLLDIDAAFNLIRDFDESTIAILKHNNVCGIASIDELSEAWKLALQGDPVSAFGGIIISNRHLDIEIAVEIDKIFFEVIIAPSYSDEVLEVLKKKKNRIILKSHPFQAPDLHVRSLLNGFIVQERDANVESIDQMEFVTTRKPSAEEIADLIFANKIVKHTKSNAIVLCKNKQLLGSGMGQTSRVDALKHAIEKAKSFHFNLTDASMASDAFFPFADCVEIAHEEGITNVIQPGGSIRDKDSISFCEENEMTMAITGIRHFKH